MHFSRICFAAAVAAAGCPLQTLAQEVRLEQVAVFLPDSYPAFQPGTAGQRKPVLRAIVIRRDPARGDSATIILNPEHANARTLRDASRLLRRAAPTGTGLSYDVLDTTQPSDEPGGNEGARLRRFLQQLQVSAARHLRGHRGRGRVLSLRLYE